jgi:sugar lactone lactonase YvrE
MLALLCCSISQAADRYRTEAVLPPGPFHGVHGLSFGPDKALYAGDIVGMSVHRIDPADGSHRLVVGAPLGMADDVAFAPPGTSFAGTMVWSGVFTGRVYARAPDGRVRLVADGLPGVNTVAFSPDGTLYATQLGPFANALWRLDLSGA